MVAPDIRARIKQPDNLASRGMSSGDVWAFVPVAVETGQREVLRGCRPAVLAGDYVVDVKRKRMSRLGEVAVFTTAK